tara:strand:- start:2589 stop:2936 length:348 start_codon:yes stop_codon:yes gene_type:complete
MEKEFILTVLFWYLVSWWITANEYIQFLVEQLGVTEEKQTASGIVPAKVTVARLAFDNLVAPFFTCPWCAAFIFVLFGVIVGTYWTPLLVALAVSFLVKTIKGQYEHYRFRSRRD